MDKNATNQAIADLIKVLRLPKTYWQYMDPFIRPLADEIARQKKYGQKKFFAIHGAQGSGKSTLAMFLRLILTQDYQFRVALVSLDDFYLSPRQRQRRAQQIHPLFQTRGVPGTHDTPLAMAIFQKLQEGRSGQVNIPVFDKAHDDLFPVERWQQLSLPVDIILFEGWCVGVQPLPKTALSVAINELEAREDPQAVWREAVNQFLATEYQQLFALIEYLIMLKIPSFECVLQWRHLQEQKLAGSRQQNLAPDNKGLMLDRARIYRFIQHFQRITEHALKTLPETADCILSIDTNHQFERLIYVKDKP